MNTEVDEYFREATQWREEFRELRRIVLDCRLTEECKWGKPSYTFQESNLVIIQGFKAYCALMFCKGALLKDAEGILIQQTANVQAARQVRFTGVREIVKLAPVLKAYLREAMAAEKAGLKVSYKETADFVMAAEFASKLRALPSLKRAFVALTPGRQRGYLLYFSAAKQAKTREARVEKCRPFILKGKGLND